MAPRAIEIPRDGEGLRSLPARMAGMIAALDMPPRLAYRAELVAEEIVTNLVKYGRPRRAPDTITLSLHREGAGFTLVIEDRAEPFSPVWAAEPERAEDIADAQPGGLGLSLVRQSCTRLDYDSFAGGNRLVAHLAP